MIKIDPAAVADLRDMVQTRGWRDHYVPSLKAAKEALRRDYEYAAPEHRPPAEQYTALIRFYDFFIDFERRLFETAEPEEAPDTINFVVK